MAEDRERIRQEIEKTRQAIRHEIEATRAEGKTGNASAAGTSGGLRSLSAATPRRQDVEQGAKRAAGLAQHDPLGLALGAVALGFVAGVLLPSTPFEHEKIGRVADQVKDKATETGQEVLERGKQVAQDGAETAKQSGHGHGDELRSTASVGGEHSGVQAAAQGRG